MKIGVKCDAKKALAQLKRIRDSIPDLVMTTTGSVAASYLEEVVSKSPDDIPGYPDMLQVFQVGTEAVFVVMPDPSKVGATVGGKDSGTTLLYVVPKVRRGVAVSPAAEVLSRHNPWTIGALPYKPKPREATFVSRRVRQIEVAARDDYFKEAVGEIRRELVSIGMNLSPVARVKTTRDIAFEVLRSEFGIYRAHKAHWRPALRSVAGNAARAANADLGRVIKGASLRYTDVDSVSENDAAVGLRFRKTILGE